MKNINVRKNKRKRRSKNSQAEVYTAAWLVAFMVLLFLILGIRSCIKSQENPLQTQEFIPQFNDKYIIRVHNHLTNHTEDISLDEYIYHVVSAEIPAAYPLEALKAQAVAARTYAVQKAKSIMGENAKQCEKGKWDICTNSACCQAWKSTQQLKERWKSNYNLYAEKVYNAVIETSYQIAVYKDRPINAMYHSTSGGYTANIEDVYGGDPVPYLRGVESPGEENASGYSSVVKMKKSEAAKLLNKEFGQNLSKNNIEDNFRVSDKNEHGFVKKTCVGTKNVTGRDIRRVFSLKSSNFTISYDSKYVIIKVTGYGHGVGMSQAGAGAMAKKGVGYTEILNHYYTGIQIKDIGDIIWQS